MALQAARTPPFFTMGTPARRMIVDSLRRTWPSSTWVRLSLLVVRTGLYSPPVSVCPAVWPISQRFVKRVIFLLAANVIILGAEYHCYCSDVTCSFPVSGTFTEAQRVVFEAVHDAQRAVMNAMKPGVSWARMHELAEATILKALINGGVLIGKVDDMVAVNLGELSVTLYL